MNGMQAAVMAAGGRKVRLREWNDWVKVGFDHTMGYYRTTLVDGLIPFTWTDEMLKRTDWVEVAA